MTPAYIVALVLVYGAVFLVVAYGLRLDRKSRREMNSPETLALEAAFRRRYREVFGRDYEGP